MLTNLPLGASPRKSLRQQQLPAHTTRTTTVGAVPAARRRCRPRPAEQPAAADEGRLVSDRRRDRRPGWSAPGFLRRRDLRHPTRAGARSSNATLRRRGHDEPSGSAVVAASDHGGLLSEVASGSSPETVRLRGSSRVATSAGHRYRMRPVGAPAVPPTRRPSNRPVRTTVDSYRKLRVRPVLVTAARQILRGSQLPLTTVIGCGPIRRAETNPSEYMVAASDNGGLLSEVASLDGCSGRAERPLLCGSQLPLTTVIGCGPRWPGGDELSRPGWSPLRITVGSYRKLRVWTGAPDGLSGPFSAGRNFH